MAEPNDFLTWQSFASFAGTTMATTAITNGLCAVFPKFKSTAALGLCLAIFFCLLIAVIDVSTGNLNMDHPFATYFIAVVNGFFVFASAAGLSAGATRVAEGTSARQATPRGPIPESNQPEELKAGFWRHWL